MSVFNQVTCAEQTSAYQCLKLDVLSLLDLSKDAAHIYVGLLVFFLAVALWKRGRLAAACLIPVLLAAMAMESMDLYDDWRHLGTLRWGASAHDIINTCLWPTVMVLLSKVGAIK